VVELRVNESALLQRVETRVAEMRARGEDVRIDDTPEVLAKRLASYRSLTEPLIHYYSERRKLLTVDGMMTIEEVTREINRILAAIGAVEPKGQPRRPEGRRSRQEDRRTRGQKGSQNRQEGRQTAPRPAKPASRWPRRQGRKPLRRPGAGNGKAKKAAKKDRRQGLEKGHEKAS
jgi:adenylate kinase